MDVLRDHLRRGAGVRSLRRGYHAGALGVAVSEGEGLAGEGPQYALGWDGHEGQRNGGVDRVEGSRSFWLESSTSLSIHVP